MTYEVLVDVQGFPDWVPTPPTLAVSDEHLIWAAVTMGERRRVPRDSDFARRAHRRVATLYDAFSTTCGCHLTHSRNYLSTLDPSDRSTISYFLGGISAKLTASLLVGVPYLVHYDAVLREHGRSLRGRRPDFVGVGNPPISARVVVEAKGTVGPANGAIADAVNQVKGSGTRTRPRRLAWGQQAHFIDPGWGEPVWSASLLDPPSEDFSFPTTEDVLLAYFAPLVRDLFSGYSVNPEVDSTWWTADIGDVGAQTAIRSDVAIAALTGDGEALLRLCGLQLVEQAEDDPTADDIREALANTSPGYWGSPEWPGRENWAEGWVGPDGVAVRIRARGAEENLDARFT